MAITPSGLPPWIRANDHSTYGGDLDKMNYLSQGVVDPRTDISAEQFVRMCEDLASVVRTCPYGSLLLLCDDNPTPDAPTVISARLMNGLVSQSYLGSTPPPGMPTVARVSDGVCTITFVSPAEDFYGVEGSVVLQGVVPTVVNGGNTVEASHTISSNATTITVTTTGGSAVQNPRLFVQVWT